MVLWKVIVEIAMWFILLGCMISMILLYEGDISMLDENNDDLRQSANECWEEEVACEAERTSCQLQLQDLKNAISTMEYSKECECIYTCVKPSFLETASEIASSHVYQKDVYDCSNYSEDLVEALEDMGWDATIQSGRYHYNGTSTGHQWVEMTVYIEATTGQVIEPEVYKERYKRGW